MERLDQAEVDSAHQPRASFRSLSLSLLNSLSLLACVVRLGAVPSWIAWNARAARLLLHAGGGHERFENT